MDYELRHLLAIGLLGEELDLSALMEFQRRFLQKAIKRDMTPTILKEYKAVRSAEKLLDSIDRRIEVANARLVELTHLKMEAKRDAKLANLTPKATREALKPIKRNIMRAEDAHEELINERAALKARVSRKPESLTGYGVGPYAVCIRELVKCIRILRFAQDETNTYEAVGRLYQSMESINKTLNHNVFPMMVIPYSENPSYGNIGIRWVIETRLLVDAGYRSDVVAYSSPAVRAGAHLDTADRCVDLIREASDMRLTPVIDYFGLCAINADRLVPVPMVPKNSDAAAEMRQIFALNDHMKDMIAYKGFNKVKYEQFLIRNAAKTDDFCDTVEYLTRDHWQAKVRNNAATTEFGPMTPHIRKEMKLKFVRKAPTQLQFQCRSILRTSTSRELMYSAYEEYMLGQRELSGEERREMVTALNELIAMLNDPRTARVVNFKPIVLLVMMTDDGKYQTVGSGGSVIILLPKSAMIEQLYEARFQLNAKHGVILKGKKIGADSHYENSESVTYEHFVNPFGFTANYQLELDVSHKSPEATHTFGAVRCYSPESEGNDCFFKALMCMEPKPMPHELALVRQRMAAAPFTREYAMKAITSCKWSIVCCCDSKRKWMVLASHDDVDRQPDKVDLSDTIVIYVDVDHATRMVELLPRINIRKHKDATKSYKQFGRYYASSLESLRDTMLTRNMNGRIVERWAANLTVPWLLASYDAIPNYHSMPANERMECYIPAVVVYKWVGDHLEAKRGDNELIVATDQTLCGMKIEEIDPFSPCIIALIENGGRYYTIDGKLGQFEEIQGEFIVMSVGEFDAKNGAVYQNGARLDKWRIISKKSDKWSTTWPTNDGEALDDLDGAMLYETRDKRYLSIVKRLDNHYISTEPHALSDIVLSLDFETVNQVIIDSKNPTRPAIVSVVYPENGKDVAKTFEGEHCADLVVDFLYRFATSHPQNRVMVYTFNGCSFDHHLLLPAIARHKEMQFGFKDGKRKSGYCLHGSKLLDITWDNLCIRDIRRYTMMSLDAVSRSLGCRATKTGWSHIKTQQLFEKCKTVDKMLEAMASLPASDFTSAKDVDGKNARQAFIEYCENDCMVTLEIVVKIHKQLSDDTGGMLNIHDSMTLPKAVYTYINEKVKKGEFKPFIPIGMTVDAAKRVREFERAAIQAGTSRVFATAPQGFKEKMHGLYIDVVSQYPHVMMQAPFPCGETVSWVNEYVPGKLGIYRVRVKKQPIVALPLKANTSGLGGHEWDYPGEHEEIVCSITLMQMARTGAEFEIIDGMVYDEHKRGMLTEHLAPFMRAKQEEDVHKANDEAVAMQIARITKYNTTHGTSIEVPKATRTCVIVRRNVSKSVLNNLSGKFVQHEPDSAQELTYGMRQTTDAIERITKRLTKKLDKMVKLGLCSEEERRKTLEAGVQSCPLVEDKRSIVDQLDGPDGTMMFKYPRLPAEALMRPKSLKSVAMGIFIYEWARFHINAGIIAESEIAGSSWAMETDSLQFDYSKYEASFEARHPGVNPYMHDTFFGYDPSKPASIMNDPILDMSDITLSPLLSTKQFGYFYVPLAAQWYHERRPEIAGPPSLDTEFGDYTVESLTMKAVPAHVPADQFGPEVKPTDAIAREVTCCYIGKKQYYFDPAEGGPKMRCKGVGFRNVDAEAYAGALTDEAREVARKAMLSCKDGIITKKFYQDLAEGRRRLVADFRFSANVESIKSNGASVHSALCVKVIQPDARMRLCVRVQDQANQDFVNWSTAGYPKGDAASGYKAYINHVEITREQLKDIAMKLIAGRVTWTDKEMFMHETQLRTSLLELARKSYGERVEVDGRIIYVDGKTFKWLMRNIRSICA